MVPIVVRAKDSAAAMEEVIARLGPEALILSTGRQNGLFEITAIVPGQEGQGATGGAARAMTSAMTPAANPAPVPETAPRTAPVERPVFQTPDFQHLIEARLSAEAEPVPQRRGSVDVAIEAPVEIDNPLAQPPMPSSPLAVASAPKRKSKRKRKATGVAPEVAPRPGIEPVRVAPVAVPATGRAVRGMTCEHDEPTPLRSATNVAAFTPDPRAPAGGWPIYSPAFRSELRDEMSDQMDGFLSNIAGPLLAPGGARVLRAPRIVIVGPSLIQTSLLALRIAAALETGSPRRRPEIVLCTDGSRADAAFIDAKARLLGWSVTHTDPAQERAAAVPKVCAPRITVCAGSRQAMRALLDDIRASGPVQVVLALSTGQHPVRLSQTITPWAPFAPVVALNLTDDLPPLAEELAVLAGHALSLGWISSGAAVVDCLTVPTRAVLKGWAQEWLTFSPPRLPDLSDPVEAVVKSTGRGIFSRPMPSRPDEPVDPVHATHRFATEAGL